MTADSSRKTEFRKNQRQCCYSCMILRTSEPTGHGRLMYPKKRTMLTSRYYGTMCVCDSIRQKKGERETKKILPSDPLLGTTLSPFRGEKRVVVFASLENWMHTTSLREGEELARTSHELGTTTETGFKRRKERWQKFYERSLHERW